MLPRERVLTTLKHREPDLIPWGEHSIDYPVYEDILGRSTFVQAKFRQAQAWWKGQRADIIKSYKRDLIDLVEALGMDLILAPMMPSVEDAKAMKPMEKIDSDKYRDEKGNVYCVSSVTQDLMAFHLNPDSYTPPTLDTIRADIDKVKREGVPEPHASCWDVVRHVVKERKATHFIATFWRDFGFPSFGQTDEDFYVNLLLHPEMLEPIAELNARQSISSLKHVASQGVDAIVTPGDLGSSTGPLADPKIYKRYVLPWHKEYVKEAHRLGLIVIKHCCGYVWDFVDDFVDIGYDGYEGIQASASMDMKRLKERVGKRLTLWGGVTNENLIGGKPDQIRADARYAIKWGAPGGGFIYGASHSLAVGTKRENLMAMKESREQWGHYPIKL